MKRFLIIFTILFFTLRVDATVLQAGVAIEQVPQALYGNWRVNAKLDTTNSYATFKPQSVDFWNLIREGDVVTLENPYSGANSSISIETIEGNLIVFSKKANYGQNKILTDTVTIRLTGDKFSGINVLKLESFSLIDNRLMKTETATYHITGEKISGQSVLDNILSAP